MPVPTSASAWVYQDAHQVEKHGADAASWYVGWYNLEGKRRCKSFGLGVKGKDKAEKFRRQVEAELEGGAYREQLKKTWKEFREEFQTRVLDRLAPRTRCETVAALDHFERIIKPVRMLAIGTKTIDQLTAARRHEAGLRPGTLVSPATVNKNLRHLKAALGIAKEWGYLQALPRFRMEREPQKLPTYVTPEHFALIYVACESAKVPRGLANMAVADWWRALIIFAFMTGRRIGSILALKREDVDLAAGTALSRAADNKGKRDQLVPLHPVVVEHLRKVVNFGPTVFPPWDRRRIFEEFARIQAAAGIKLSGKGHYGFHDLRRAFATMNADKLTPDALQALMQHKDYQTTQRYINMARQLNPAVGNLYVPDLTPKAQEPPRKAAMEG
jgi:integrase